MGFLNQKEQILEITLTDRGRDLLSQNQLNFIYFAFSDEELNYSGSLAATNSNLSASIDNIVFRNFSFEGTQRKNQDLKSFLYTIPPGTKKIPELTKTTPSTTPITLKRVYSINSLHNINHPNGSFTQAGSVYVDLVVRATFEPQNRIADYVIEQNVLKYLKKF
jgi:hypothetical protein